VNSWKLGSLGVFQLIALQYFRGKLCNRVSHMEHLSSHFTRKKHNSREGLEMSGADQQEAQPLGIPTISGAKYSGVPQVV